MPKNFSWKYILYVLLFLYICYIVISMHEFSERMEYILHYPVRVSQETREMKTRVLEMQHTLPGLLATPTLNYRDFEEVFQRQDAAQDASFAKVEKLLGAHKEELEETREAFVKIRAARRQVAREMIGNSDYKTAIALYNKTVAPQVAHVYDCLNNLFLIANRVMQTAQKDTRTTAITNIYITIILGIVIMVAFIYSDHLEKIKNNEIKARDKLFNQLSQNVDEVFIISKDASSFDYVSPNSERLIGIPAQEILKTPDVLYNFLPFKESRWLRSVLSGHEDGSEVWKKDVVLDNDTHIFKIIVHPINKKEKSGDSYIISLHDQTKEYLRQKTLHDALSSANSASAAKSSFLSHMSHEIRTPMNAIIGMTAIALNRINDRERVEDCLVKIGESSKHLLELINEVLDMSKIENGRLTISHAPFSLAHTIQSISRLVLPQMQASKINFEIFQNIEEEALLGDSLRLNQILLNILSNAVKFTPADGKITMHIEQVKKWGTNVLLRFTIADTGIGMSQEFMHRLFTPFEQASAQITTRYGGTGLGMSITYNLVNLMGGTINVSSEEGKGTTFVVELPFGFQEKSAERPVSLPHLRVLVVDDDHGTCEHASMLLENMGMTVTWALNGQEAIKIVQDAWNKNEKYEVCFIDWKMPDMDGAETARCIRKIVGTDVLIIIISAYDWSSIEEEARSGGVDDFIAKPFFASTLYETLLSSTKRLGLEKSDAESSSQKNYDFTGSRILLVEDNDFNREIAHEFLGMINIEVEDAVNGEEAVKIFNNSEPGHFDLVLMDVQMPIMDGYEATRQIRAGKHPDARDIPVLAMTANAFREDVTNALGAGMNGHIAKPIDIKALFQTLAKYLNKKT